jgi:hypothetical protein
MDQTTRALRELMASALPEPLSPRGLREKFRQAQAAHNAKLNKIATEHRAELDAAAATIVQFFNAIDWDRNRIGPSGCMVFEKDDSLKPHIFVPIALPCTAYEFDNGVHEVLRNILRPLFLPKGWQVEDVFSSLTYKGVGLRLKEVCNK